MAHHISIKFLFQYWAKWELRNEELHDLCDTDWNDELLDSVDFWIWANQHIYLHDSEAVLFVGNCIQTLLDSLTEKLDRPILYKQVENIIEIKTNDNEEPIYWIRRP